MQAQIPPTKIHSEEDIVKNSSISLVLLGKGNSLKLSAPFP